MLRDPAQLPAARLELLAVVERSHEPLAARDDLERPLALLEELHRVLDRARLGRERTGLGQQVGDLLLRLLGALSGQPVVGGLRLGGIVRLEPGLAPADLSQTAVGLDHRADRQSQLAPPHHVGHVAEGAHHRDPGALLRVGELVREHGEMRAEERGDGLASFEQRAVALVARVRDQRHAGGDQLRPGGLDLDRLAAAGSREQDAVGRARGRAVLELGLRHRGAEVDVPERRRLYRVDQVLAEEVDERALRRALGALADRRVGHRPVHGEAEPAPELFERLLVLGRQPQAELNEVLARDRNRVVGRLRRGLEPGVVRQRGVTADAEVVLDAPLRGQPVVVPPHRVKDALPAHPLEARDQVGVAVREDVPDVEGSAHGGRRRVDRVDLVAGGRAAECVGAVALPALRPLRLYSLQRWLVRQACWHASKRICAYGDVRRPGSA